MEASDAVVDGNEFWRVISIRLQLLLADVFVNSHQQRTFNIHSTINS